MTREILIKVLIQHDIDTLDTGSLADIFEYGFKRYNSFSDGELVEMYHSIFGE